jgi:phosphopantothenoylcysteine decarboxylase
MKKPLLFCPAMNTHMWEHPVTATHIAALKKWGYIEVPCIAKTLICGDTGLGAMAEVSSIVDTIYETLRVHYC